MPLFLLLKISSSDELLGVGVEFIPVFLFFAVGAMRAELTPIIGYTLLRTSGLHYATCIGFHIIAIWGTLY